MVDILEESVFEPEEEIDGFKQDDLGDIWWQTFLEIPSDENALLFEDATDPDGAAGSSQKASLTRTDSIQFLAGIFNETGEAERTITVPGGSVFFFPILNAILPDPYNDEDGNLAGGIGGVDPNGDPITEEGIRTELKALIEGEGEEPTGTEGVQDLNVSIDGVPIHNLFDYRQESPEVFDVFLPENNIFGVSVDEGGEEYGGVLSDGYWLGFDNLAPEDHEIDFGGALDFVNPDDQDFGETDFELDVKYNISFDLNEIVGTNGQDTEAVRGTEEWDEISGLNGRDNIVGLEGNDALSGGNGPDTLIGVNPDGSNPGEREIDILDGGRGPDTLVLGDSDKAYYVGQGSRDYAIIRGFRNEDTIQLSEKFDYKLDNTLTLGNEPGTGILLEGTEELELIGFVEGVTDLSLDSNDFIFV